MSSPIPSSPGTAGIATGPATDDPADDLPDTVAIVGGGAAGTMIAIHALRLATAPLRIVLVEPAAALGEGVAYATDAPEHRLNVPVRRMSAFVDQPGDFLDFMLERHNPAGLSREALGDRYAQRGWYAEYLRERLRQAREHSAARLVMVRGHAVALDRIEGATAGWRLTLASGAPHEARGVALAVGNEPRPLPAPGADALAPVQRLEAWQYDAISKLPGDADIAIVGSGLSMVDVALTLQAHGHRGRIHVLSRHGLMPLAHADTHAAADFDPAGLLDQSLRQRLHALRRLAADAATRGEAWQDVLDRVRPHVQALWQSLSDADQRRFLRHVVRQWDVHRHRVAPDVHATIQALRAGGQLQLHRGRLQSLAAADGRVRLEARMAGGGTLQLLVDHVVNATGVETRAQAMHNPLLRDLLAKGLARPGPHGIGIDTVADGRVGPTADGLADLLAIGSLRIGRLWESVAVPELRVQSEAAARRLVRP